MVQKKSAEVNPFPSWSLFVIASLGFWLLTAPGSFNFQSRPLIFSDLVSGILLIALSLFHRQNPKQWILWTIASIGAWIQLSPLIFWAPDSASYLTNVLIGSMVIAFSVVLFPLPHELPSVEPTIPKGWSYNPSSFSQRLPVAVLVFLCWTISRYLACYQLGYIDTIWDPFFTPGTKAVIESSISKDFPVSDAGLGALAYTIEFFTVIQGGKARWRTAPWLVLVYGVLVVPVALVSMTLVILQPLVVGTWCTLCLATAACMLFAIPFAIDEVIASIEFLNQKGWKHLFKGGECPEASVDHESPKANAPFLALLQASAWGMNFSWNFTLTAFLGILLMATPAILGIQGLLFDLDPILGAFITVCSVICFAEKLKELRWAILCFSVILLLAAFVSKEYVLLHSAYAVFFAFFSCVRKKGVLK